MDRLCDRARGRNTDVRCFHLGFAERREQSAAGMLGSLLERRVGGMERILEETSRVFQGKKRVVGGRRQRLLVYCTGLG